MQKYSVVIEGVAPLLQHKFGIAAQTELADTVKQHSGQRQYSGEWLDTAYILDSQIVQPAEHIWQSMVRAAVNFKIKGRGHKTYKDMISSAVIIEPDLIPHGLNLPQQITNDPSQQVYIDVRPVRVQRARVLRERLALRKGWRLAFDILVYDDQLPKEVTKAILDHAGDRIGIGDYRPRFGRFIVTKFEQA